MNAALTNIKVRDEVRAIWKLSSGKDCLISFLTGTAVYLIECKNEMVQWYYLPKRIPAMDKSYQQVAQTVCSGVSVIRSNQRKGLCKLSRTNKAFKSFQTRLSGCMTLCKYVWHFLISLARNASVFWTPTTILDSENRVRLLSLDSFRLTFNDSKIAAK